MAKIVLQSWREGMNKVAVDKLLAYDVGLGLSRGKGMVDALLAGRPGTIQVPSDSAQSILQRLRALGVDCELTDGLASDC